ncbi:MAG: hypothetical protein RLZZ234_561 [Candidatus Parcubacteria bacterium]|jgi:hypothetical protein
MKVLLLIGAVLAVIGGWYMTHDMRIPASLPERSTETQDAQRVEVEQKETVLALVSLTGTYVCLPLLGTTAPPSNECAYGLKTDEGIYYAVNYEAKAGYMDQFREGQRITATGYTTERAKLIPNRWEKFEAQGLYTITEKPVVVE